MHYIEVDSFNNACNKHMLHVFMMLLLMAKRWYEHGAK